MQKKIWIIIAVVLLIGGMGLFFFAMQNLDWDYRELSTSKYETLTYDITEDFQNIQIDINTADISFYPSEDGKCRVECKENEKFKNSVSVIDNTLTVKENENTNWYDRIGFYIDSAKISVYLPEKEYNFLNINASTSDVLLGNLTTDTVKIKISTGDIKLTDINCGGDLNLDVSTGDIDLKSVICENFTSQGSTGTIKLESVLANNKLSLKRSTGNIEFSGLDASELDIKTSTGDVFGTLRSDKVFITKSNTGVIKVPKTKSGGKCKIETNTGDIKIAIE